MNLKQSFLNEADELLNSINDHILMLEEHPDDEENVNHIFRAAHTLKGSANLYGYSGIAVLTHLLEGILDELRSRTRSLEPTLTDVLLESFDQIRLMVGSIAIGAEDPQSEPELLHRLSQYRAKSEEPMEKLEPRPRLFSADPEEWIRMTKGFMQGEKAGDALAHLFPLYAVLDHADIQPDRTQAKHGKALAQEAAQLAAIRFFDEALTEQIGGMVQKLTRLADKKRENESLQILFMQMIVTLTLLEQYTLREKGGPSVPPWWYDVWQAIAGTLSEWAAGRSPVAISDMVLDLWDLCKPRQETKQEFGTLLAPEVEEGWEELQETAAALQLEEPPKQARKESVSSGIAPEVTAGLAKKLIVEQIHFLAPKGRPLIERWDLARGILHRCAAVLGDEELHKLSQPAAPDIYSLKELAARYTEVSIEAASVSDAVKPGAEEAVLPKEQELPEEEAVAEAVAIVEKPERTPAPLRSGRGELSSESEKIIRVETGKVERVMELIGELAIAKNAFPFMIRGMLEDPYTVALARDLKERYAMLDRITKELQDAIVDIRMLPVSHVFTKFNRFVRDMARQSGKHIRLEFSGEETTLDKTLVEALSDPLIHLIRNAIDHGIEAPEDRVRAGKPPEGLLSIGAFREGNRVVLEVGDDGAGIDVERIRAKLREHQLVEGDKLEKLQPQELIPYIFHTGFSTAEEVTSLSGRGIGMDAVRTTIVRLQGDVQVVSEPGEGTRVRIELPLTLSMTQVLQVKVGGDPYGIPLDQIEETGRVSDADLQTMQGQPIVILREQVYKVIDLRSYFGLAGQEEEKSGQYLVILKSGLALKVDSLLGQQEVVVKPPQDGFKHLSYLAGASILGDGTVLLIINGNAIFLESTDYMRAGAAVGV
ncbi:chemotaxis protein CheA [Paenibacillus silviterrae]|uniref:chemotaxis protein CheA n=1 Tax=Paenibacillus silviterrae TaxID=3242194 RepID=UPI0025428C24|nr:chemotaxis protein CheA [Paenibacillus chinjuensis]